MIIFYVNLLERRIVIFDNDICIAYLYIGSFGVHTTMCSTDKETNEFYTKLGFVELNPAQEEHPGIKTMCRSF